MSGHRGFFYHFLDMQTGARFKDTELSSVDTTLLLGGVLFAQSYFDRPIRGSGDPRARRAHLPARGMGLDAAAAAAHRHGLEAESGMLAYDWNGYNEALLVYVLALGLADASGRRRGLRGLDLHLRQELGQLRRAGAPDLPAAVRAPVLAGLAGPARRARRVHAQARPGLFREQPARDAGAARLRDREPARLEGLRRRRLGPDRLRRADRRDDRYRGEPRLFRTYSARGVGREFAFDDGTLAPTAAIGSMPFAPEVVIPAIEAMHARYGSRSTSATASWIPSIPASTSAT
jgi:hypothetical protein